MPGILAEALSLALFLGLGSGSGRLIPRRWWINGSRSIVCSSYLIGTIVFAALYAIAVQLYVPFAVAIGGTVAFLTIGAAGLARVAVVDARSLINHAVVAVAIGSFWLVGGAIAGNQSAIDPWFYAASPFFVFRSDWLDANLAALSVDPDFAAPFQAVVVSRAAASAVLWPLALLGAGISIGQVSEAGVGLLLVAAILCADLVDSTRAWVRLALGLGSVAIYNAISILTGGQLNQAMALVIVVGCLWLVRATTNLFSLAVLGLGSYIISASYPEFLVVLPLYILALAVKFNQRLSITALQFMATFAGFGVEQVISRGGSLGYLLYQSSASAGWTPLPFTPTSPTEAVLDLVLETRPPWLAVGLVALWTAIFWLRWRPKTASTGVPTYVAPSLAILCVVWAIAILRSPNLNYAVFKLGGWLAPGLILLAWWLANALEGQWRRFVEACVLALALARSAALLFGGIEVLNLERPALAEQPSSESGSTGGRCVVAVDTSSIVGIPRAIAHSAAPFHDCSLVRSVGIGDSVGGTAGHLPW
jgi:hypothetical protein